MTGQLPRVFALTICAYRLPGMDEEAYHRYTSEKHALLVKELLIKKRILGYTMVRKIFLSHKGSKVSGLNRD